jgi:hypothetical protein
MLLADAISVGFGRFCRLCEKASSLAFFSMYFRLHIELHTKCASASRAIQYGRLRCSPQRSRWQLSFKHPNCGFLSLQLAAATAGCSAR